MDMTIRPMKIEERKYSYTQDEKAIQAAACIGHLRGDMDSNGIGFFTSWDNHTAEMNDDAFKSEFDTVVNMLRFDERFGGLLKNRSSLAANCYANQDSAFNGNYTQEYGFRADTDKHSYMIRCNPNKGDYNFYIYAYQREQLDRCLNLEQLVQTPLYLQTAAYAREHDELPDFRASNKANIACKEAIEKVINSNYRDNCLDSKTAFAQVAELFGTERIKYVLAVTVRQKDWDGRISHDNKAWAKTVLVVDNKDAFSSDRNCYFVVDQAHTGLVDLFVAHARKQFAAEKNAPEKKPSVLGKLQQAQPPKVAPVSKSKDMEL